MQLSAKTQNACLALVELARQHDSGQPVPLKSIADEQRMSSQFLVQILAQLRRSGLVQSVRGSSGGYRLSRSPSDITLWDILCATEGVPEIAETTDATAAARALHTTWQSLQATIQEELSATTLESLAERASSRTGDMYYI